MAYAGSESSKRCRVSGGGYGDMHGDGWMDGPLAIWVERERVNRAEMASDCAELMLIDLAEETDLELSGFVASSRHLCGNVHARSCASHDPTERHRRAETGFGFCQAMRAEGPVCFRAHGAVQYVCTVVCALVCGARRERLGTCEAS